MLLPLVPVRAVNVPAAFSNGAERVPPSKPPPLVLGRVRAEPGVATSKSESWIPGGCSKERTRLGQGPLVVQIGERGEPAHDTVVPARREWIQSISHGSIQTSGVL